MASWDSWRAYRAVLSARVAAQRSYRANFRIDLGAAALMGFAELAEVMVIYAAVGTIAGFDINQMLLVFGFSELAFATADLVFGHCDQIPRYLHEGTWDVFYLRPQPLLLQLITSDITLRRISRMTIGAVALGAGFLRNDINWSVSAGLLVVVALLSGLVIFAASFVWAAGVQFFLVNAPEFTNAFVYGGRFASTQPGAVWSRPMKLVFGFAIPVAFTGFLPAATLLDQPTGWLPIWAGWVAPLAAIWMSGFAWLTWRVGVRHYQGGGG